jgi:hypothetical protein
MQRAPDMKKPARFLCGLAIAAAAFLPRWAQAAGPGWFWTAAGNGEKGEIAFGLHEHLGYFDQPLRVSLGRREQRRSYSLMVGHGGGYPTRMEVMNLRDARCEPATLCRVTIVDQPDEKHHAIGEVRVDFLSAGEGRLVVSGRSGISLYTDSWPIAADPIPDGIARDAFAEIVIPPGGEITIDVAATLKGRRLRGPVTARIEESQSPRAGFGVLVGNKNLGPTCRDGNLACERTPLAAFASQRTVLVWAKRTGRATLVLEAGTFTERIPVRTQGLEPGAVIEPAPGR